MAEAKKEVMLSLKVMINKEKSKVVFAEADNHFVDILLSFLTFPLGRILKIDKAPTIGSLSNLYHSFTNLDAAHFMNKDAKDTLLNPATCFPIEYDMLKVDLSDFSPDECSYCPQDHHPRLRIRIFTDYAKTKICRSCKAYLFRGYVTQTAATCSDGAFTLPQTSFIISDDLQIFPSDKGLFGVIASLGITDMDEAEPITVNFGFTEIMKLLKASLTSSAPLSDVILNKKTPLNQSAGVQSQLKIAKEENYPNSSGNFVSLKVMRQKSTGKFLYAEAKEKFIDFLFGLFLIPLGGTEQLVAGKSCFKAINNLWRSVPQDIDCKYFKKPDMKNRLMKVNLPHQDPNGRRSYLSGSRTYEVTDDLTVKPFCMFSIMSTLKRQKIPISDVEEVELQIGLEKGLSILKASFTSTTALSDALLTHTGIPNKRPKREV